MSDTPPGDVYSLPDSHEVLAWISPGGSFPPPVPTADQPFFCCCPPPPPGFCCADIQSIENPGHIRISLSGFSFSGACYNSGSVLPFTLNGHGINGNWILAGTGGIYLGIPVGETEVKTFDNASGHCSDCEDDPEHCPTATRTNGILLSAICFEDPEDPSLTIRTVIISGDSISASATWSCPDDPEPGMIVPLTFTCLDTLNCGSGTIGGI